MTGDLATIAICFSEVSGTRLALDAERVHSIDDHHAAVADGPPCLDVVEALGLPPYPRGAPRRAAVLGAAAQAPRVVLGARVDVDAVAPAELQCLPPFLAALELHPGFMGVIQRPEGLWLMLDVDRLLARHAERAGVQERDDG